MQEGAWLSSDEETSPLGGKESLGPAFPMLLVHHIKLLFGAKCLSSSFVNFARGASGKHPIYLGPYMQT